MALGRYINPGWRGRLFGYLPPILVLLALAEISLRLGQADLIGDRGLGKIWYGFLPIADVLYDMGLIISDHFPLVIAMVIAFAMVRKPTIGLGVVTLVGWFGFQGGASAMSRYGVKLADGTAEPVNYGIIGGVIIGLGAAVFWSALIDTRLHSFMKMIQGVPLVFLVISVMGVLAGLVLGLLYTGLYWLLVEKAGGTMSTALPLFAGMIYGLLQPVAAVAGLDHLFSRVPFFSYGTCNLGENTILHGNYNCVINGATQTEGQAGLFMAGGYPAVFGLAVMMLVLWLKMDRKRSVYFSALYAGIILCLLVAGQPLPALLLLLMGAGHILLLHFVASSISYMVAAMLKITIGFGGGPGLVDLAVYGRGNPSLLKLLAMMGIYGLVYGVFAWIMAARFPEHLYINGYAMNQVATRTWEPMFAPRQPRREEPHPASALPGNAGNAASALPGNAGNAASA